MKAEQFDTKFDSNDDDIIDSLDKEASRIGVTRQSIIKVWLVERLEQQTAKTDIK
ncbi:MAG: hypothetical protein ACI9LE_001969 [Paraglaciecola sp.]|jgi:hypothetical protein